MESFLGYHIFHRKKDKIKSMDLGALLDNCSWYDIGNFLQTPRGIKNSLLQAKSIEIKPYMLSY